jgi:acetyl-CoA carboxylase biotin carboxylase subunit/3-methylcrotonyl-CoA carboxylase alpha subunit
MAGLLAEAERIGFPVLVKAAGGGGGIGMQVARGPEELAAAAKTSADRGRQAFLDARVYLERYLDKPRHIELQMVRDRHGSAVCLGERECSVQRRHQKVVEESPSPAAFLAGEAGVRRRRDLGERAIALLDSVDYAGVATVELVADASGALYFLEVNARLQVEHPVTELVTGLDLVELQLRVAAGERLPADVLAATSRGHAVEARLYAEDPSKGFLPQPGRIERLRLPEGVAGVRVDAGYAEGGEVTPHYDPLMAKLSAHGATRDEAIERLLAALAVTDVALVGPRGPRTTNLGFLQEILRDPGFRSGEYDTGLLSRMLGRPSVS